MKKVLILYAKYGGGHLSAAKSIETYIEDHYFYNTDVKCVDCMDYINPFVSSVTTNTYKNMTQKTPKLWKKLYHDTRKGPLANISSRLNNIMANRLNKLFKEYSPDIVISTHPFASQMTSYLKAHKKTNCVLASVLTDFAPHDQWLVGREYGDFFFVSNIKMRQELIDTYNIPEEKVFATGIPLANTFSYPFYDNETYKSYQLNPDKKLILFFGGGEFGLGQKSTVTILRAFAKHLDEYQIIAISGKNNKMNSAFLDLYNELQNEDLHVLRYSNDIPDLMHISSLVVTKPGGLTSSESLASHLPIIIINPIPGQEEENAEFLENSGAAIWIKNTDNIDELITSILKDKDKLEDMKQKAIQIAKPASTMDICHIILGDLN
jgi:processive 1,2-diacylglycerol beta-glucosyltransferase